MYKGVGKIFKRYWLAYGGWQSLLKSPYFHAAVFLLAVTWNTWCATKWWDIVIGALPNLLGFTLAGFAIFIGFGDEKFRELLAEPDEDSAHVTVYVSLCATFVHFIVVQILALIVAVVVKSMDFHLQAFDPIREWIIGGNCVVGAFGYGVFLYALTSVLAATMHVFRIASMYESYQRHRAMMEKSSKCPNAPQSGSAP